MSNERGRAVAGDDEEGRGRVPKLRFPAFKDSALHEVQLGHVTEEGNVRNKGRLATDVIMGVSKENGMVPMQAHVIASDISRYKVVRKDWFAYNPMRLNIGSIARWHGDDDALVSPDYVVFHCPKRSMEPSLLPVYFDHFRRSTQWDAFTNEAGDGGVRVRIYYGDIAQVRLVLPDSDEQQKIADCLSSLDAVIAAEADRLAALKAHKKGLMQRLFPAPGQTTPRLRFPEFKGAAEWVVQPLGGICDLRAGKFVSASDIADAPDNDLFPCYGGNGLRGYTRSYTHSGTFPLVGRQGAHCGNVKFVTGNFHATEHALVATAKCATLVGWLYYKLVALELNRFATGQAQPGLSVDVLEKIPCVIPNEETEQQRIADCLSSLDSLVAAQSNKLEALKTQKSGIMQKLFPSPHEASA